MRDSPSKLINKLLEQTKLDAAKIKQLEAKLLVKASDDKHMADQRVINIVAQHEADWAHAALERTRLLDAINTHLSDNKAINSELVSSRQACAELMATLKIQIGQRQDLEIKLAEVEPRIALLEAQRADLTKLCDKVRDRMKRKELEEERAILNRKAMAGVRPDVLRGQ